MMARDGFRRGASVLFGVLLAGLPAKTGLGQERPDSGEIREGADFLLLPVGAQGVGLGRAMTALHSQEAAFWNPAGLAGQSARRAMIYSGQQLAGPAIAVNVLLPWDRVGTFGVSYFLLDIGEQLSTDPNGNPLGSFTTRNHVGIASLGTSFPGGIDAGVNLKIVQFRVGCRGQCQDLETSSSAYALDVGVQAQPFTELPLRFGWMMANAGTDFQILDQEQGEALPTRLRFAVAYEFLHRVVDDGMMELWLSLEAEDRPRNPGSPSWYLGLDYSAGNLVHVRAGYVGGKLDQTDGATVGVGFRFDRFDLSLAKYLTRSLVIEEGQPLHVSLGVAF